MSSACRATPARCPRTSAYLRRSDAGGTSRQASALTSRRSAAKASPRSATCAMDDRNVLVAGIPRSGTTLTCHLLNSLPDIVALHEPIGEELMGDMSEPRGPIDRF